MKRSNSASAAVLIGALVTAGAPAGSARAEEPLHKDVVAIIGARIVVGQGSVIEKGAMVLAGDRILQVGPMADVIVPPEARRIDLSDVPGAMVTPGFFDAESGAGLAEVSLEQSTVEQELDGRYDAIRAAFLVADGINPQSVVIPVTRLEGITTVALAPRGGFVSGRGAVVRLAGRTVDEMMLARQSAMYLRWGEAGRAATFGARGGLSLRLRELVDDVRQYATRRGEFERNQMRKLSASRLDLEAMVPALGGQKGEPMPVVVEVHRAADILAVLRLAKELGIRVILSGCEEGWLVAREIAEAKAPVILQVLTDLPASFESLGSRLDNAALLHRAGVLIAISTRAPEPHNSRTLRFEAGNAVANGLPYYAAMAAVTMNPARIFGLDDRVGSIAPGMQADVVVWSGDPFETSTRPLRVFVRGREQPMRSRQTELMERYRRVGGMRQ